MRTPLPDAAKPFARWGGRALSVSRLTEQHTRVSARLSVEPRPAHRFNLRLEQQCLAAARASQTHPFTHGVRLVFGTGAHGLIDAQCRMLAQPSISRIGLIGYLSVLPLEPIRAGYGLALKSIFGEALYEPRMLQILDRIFYWTTACACEASAVLGLGVRYFWMACCIGAALPVALALSIRTAVDHHASYEGLVLREQFEAASARMSFLLRAMTVDCGEGSGASANASYFRTAVEAGLVSIESSARSDSGQGVMIHRLTPAPTAQQSSARWGASETICEPLCAQLQLEALCNNDLNWANRVVGLTRKATLEALVQTVSLQEHLFIQGQKGRLELSDGAGELRLISLDDDTLLLKAEVLFEAPHPVYARFGVKRIDLSFTRVRCAADIAINRVATDALPFTVQKVACEISSILAGEA